MVLITISSTKFLFKKPSETQMNLAIHDKYTVFSTLYNTQGKLPIETFQGRSRIVKNKGLYKLKRVWVS